MNERLETKTRNETRTGRIRTILVAAAFAAATVVGAALPGVANAEEAQVGPGALGPALTDHVQVSPELLGQLQAALASEQAPPPGGGSWGLSPETTATEPGGDGPFPDGGGEEAVTPEPTPTLTPEPTPTPAPETTPTPTPTPNTTTTPRLPFTGGDAAAFMIPGFVAMVAGLGLVVGVAVAALRKTKSTR
jgi:hypothetical protein